MANDYMATYKGALDRLSTGGMSLQAELKGIEESKKQAIAGGQQAMVTSGLAGTTGLAGVSLQAEKTAATSRLGARGRAETKYLSALMSFATLAQQAREGELSRTASMERLRTSIQGQKDIAIKQGQYSGGFTGGGGGGYSTGLGGTGGGGGTLGPGQRISGLTGRLIDVSGTLGSGSKNSTEYPSLYDTPGGYMPVPDWMGGEVSQEQVGEQRQEVDVGSQPWGERVAPTIEEPGSIKQGMWYNYITNERSYGATKPTGGHAPAGWMWQGG